MLNLLTTCGIIWWSACHLGNEGERCMRCGGASPPCVTGSKTERQQTPEPADSSPPCVSGTQAKQSMSCSAPVPARNVGVGNQQLSAAAAQATPSAVVRFDPHYTVSAGLVLRDGRTWRDHLGYNKAHACVGGSVSHLTAIAIVVKVKALVLFFVGNALRESPSEGYGAVSTNGHRECFIAVHRLPGGYVPHALLSRF